MPMSADSFAELVVATSTQPHAPMIAARQLAPVIARCLAKAPDERYPNMAELAADLARFTDRPLGLACAARAARILGIASPVQAPTEPALAATTHRSTRSARRIAIVAAVGVAIAVPTLILAMRPDRTPPALPEPPHAAIAPAATPAQAIDAAPAVDPPAAPAAASAAPVPAVSTPSPIVRTSPPGSPAAAVPAPTANPAVRRKPRSAGSAGCDPYATPEGC
jgi:hypothetical protein